MASSNNWAKGKRPNRDDNSTQALTAPGTGTESHPSRGISVLPRNLSALRAAGDRPEAVRQCNWLPSHTMANASLPRPLLVGSTTYNAMAVATAASTELPPFLSTLMHACTARGCEIATMFFAKTGDRFDV